MTNQIPIALFVFSNDLDDFLPNIERERKIVEEALEHYDDTNRLKIIARSSVSIDELFRLFTRYSGRIVLFHFAGHAGGKGLHLNEDITNTTTGKAEGIASLIRREVEHGILQLVFLNGCSTAPQVDGLKAAGVPSIIATNYPINDNKAVNFARQFYRIWTKADNILEAFNEPFNTIQQAFEAGIAYLKLQNTVGIKDTTRGFVFKVNEVKTNEPWELFSENPDQKLEFNIAKESKTFNEFLTRRLIEQLVPYSRPASKFLPIANKKMSDWESHVAISNKAKEIIVYSFVGVLGIQLQKLFAIGKEVLSKEKEKKYIETCLYTSKRTFKLLNFALISKLWDYRTQTSHNFQLNATQKDAIQHFFDDDFELDIQGHFDFLKNIYSVFKDNNLPLPFDGMDNLETTSNTILAKAVKKLQHINQVLDKSQFELKHCFAVEKQLVTVLETFIFLATYKMISIRGIAYDEMRNQSPRYIHTYTVLGIDAKQNVNAERVRTDDVPINTDAILLFKGKRYQESINLFPFIIDWNTLIFEDKAKTCFYDSKDFSDGSLNYRFLSDNKVMNITKSEALETESEIAKIVANQEKFKNLKLDLVHQQFYEAKIAILGKDEVEENTDDFDDLFDAEDF
ncbi:MAG: CHAT domain-containing protein [Saprospiraceae bacterium]